jgi:peptidoglycan/xylan/chitin deacetylase (PgdA/CDA1 family)
VESGYEIPVLMYHQVLRSRSQAGRFDTWVLESALRRQLEHLARGGYQTITFRDLDRPAVQPGRRRIILTFDDGYEDNYTTLFPLLREFGFTAVIFMVTGLRSNTWAAAQGEPVHTLMTPAQAREMAAHGVEFGGHTRTHVNFDVVSPEVARAEIAGCRADLKEWLGVEPVSFAYPYGAIHDPVKAMVREAGFRWGISTKSGPASPGADPLHVRRLAVSYRTGMPVFRWKVSGHYHEPWHGLGRALGLRR